MFNIFCFTCKIISIKELNDFMKVLDAHVAKKKQQQPGLTARKVRKEGKPYECLPPPLLMLLFGQSKTLVSLATHTDIDLEHPLLSKFFPGFHTGRETLFEILSVGSETLLGV